MTRLSSTCWIRTLGRRTLLASVGLCGSTMQLRSFGSRDSRGDTTMCIRIVVAIVPFASLSVVIGCNRVEGVKPGSKDVRAPGIPSSPGVDHAMGEFDQAIQQNPMNSETHAARAAAWLNKGNYDQALNDYDRAIRLEPE